MARTGSQRKGQLASNDTSAAAAAASSAAGNLDQNISRKSKFRYLTARSEAFEKQLAELLQSLSGYARRSAKLRDSGDNVAEALNAISIGEVLNPSLKGTTSELAKSIRVIQDHRDSEVLYFEDKLLPTLSQFGASLQKQREEVRSTTNKVFDGKGDAGSGRSKKWSTSAASRSSSTRRSQSAERAEKPSKEEKALQQTVQRYELRRNLVLRKVLLKLILSELRYTIRSFNSLTDIYKHLSRGFSPVDDLKMFNDFFHFRSINRASLNEVEGDVSDVESEEEEEEASDEEDDDEDDEGAESGLEEKEDDSEDEDDTDGDMSPGMLDSRRSNRSNEEESETSSRSDQLVSIQSTLRRFNSTPEIPVTSSGSNSALNSIVGSKGSSKNNKWNG